MKVIVTIDERMGRWLEGYMLPSHLDSFVLNLRSGAVERPPPARILAP